MLFQVGADLPRQPSFDIGIVETGDTLRLVVTGELDIATAPDLEAAIEAAAARDVQRILVDLAAVPFVDSSGLKVLLRAVDRSAADSCRLSITRPGPQARQLFELSGALPRLPLAD